MELDALPAALTPSQMAEFLQTTPAALAQDRYLGRGLPYIRIGRRIRYMRADVLKYLQGNRVGGDAA